jgi:dihydroorotate dehydrogenase (NAD+) catalytic subunit
MAAITALPSAIVTRGTTLRPHPGAAPPRMTATRGGLVSAIGSPNPGVVRVLEQYAPRWAAWDVPVVLALCADDAAGFASLARAADAQSGVAGLELHLGCRDVGARRRHNGTKADASIEPDAVRAHVAAVRAETDLPILAKVGAFAPDVGLVAAAAVEGGADAICAIDGLPSVAIDRAGRRLALGSEVGSLSGPAILPVALLAVAQVARSVRVPIVGIGGVATLDDVLDLLMAGASAVGMATAVLGDPALPGRLARELDAWCRAEGITSIREIVGAASPQRRGRTRRR